MTAFSVSVLQKKITQLTSAKNFLVAYSGGLDSHVLLHSLVSLSQQLGDLQVRAIHVNHGLSQLANDWQNHSQQVCDSLNVELIIENIAEQIQHEQHRGDSLEQVARDYRYQAMAQHLQNTEVLVTAHNQTDQVETLLMRLFRGSGVKGLAAMNAVRMLKHTQLIRPLLDISRKQLERYAQQNKLGWVEDDSNADQRFDRNYIRQQLLPQLTQRWPGLINNITRTAQHMFSADKLLTLMADEDLTKLSGSREHTLSINKLLKLEQTRGFNVLRNWLQQLTLPLPSTVILQQIWQQLSHGSEDANPLICWEAVEVRRYQDDLYAMSPPATHDNNLVIDWNLQHDLALPNNLGVLQINELTKAGIKVDSLKQVAVRFRQGGERCHLPDQEHSQSLKKLMQQKKIPPWLRDRVPLIYVGDQLKMVYIDTNYCHPERATRAEG